MTATVLEYNKTAHQIAHFIRIDGSHIKCGELYAAGRLPIKRAVFDASRIKTQKEFVDSLRRDGVEIILDTEVAELAARAKFQTHVKKTPWAAVAEGELLDSSYFEGDRNQMNIVDWIARFAVEKNVSSVLAPTHFLADRNYDNWLTIDTKSCLALRKALDREGGRNIAIDYPIIHSHMKLNQLSTRNSLIERVVDLPIDNVWIRASGLGSEPKPQSAKQFLTSLYDFQRLSKPLIIDHTDGLMAQALIAFGGASGLAQGIGERCRFDANTWHKKPKYIDPNKPFGRASYIPISGLGRRLKKNELELLANAKSGHKYLACQDPCCLHGVKNMLADTKQHTAHQTLAPINNMAKVPDLNRENYFIEKPLREAERLSRNIKDLNPSQVDASNLKVDLSSLKKRMTEHHRKIGKFSDTLRLIHDAREAGAPRAMACNDRTMTGFNTTKKGEQ